MLFKLRVTNPIAADIFEFGGSNGAEPFSAPVEVGPTLYGTTSSGGTGSLHYGTVYSFNLYKHTETVLYSFTGKDDGAYPSNSLVYDAGNLIGVAEFGLTSKKCPRGYGSIFGVNATTGAETTIYDFTGGDDGSYPMGPLIQVGHDLYGTTGGFCQFGAKRDSTIFRLVPPIAGQTKWTLTTIYRYPATNTQYLEGLIYANGAFYGEIAGGNGAIFKFTR
jgi:hypothetical protein